MLIDNRNFQALNTENWINIILAQFHTLSNALFKTFPNYIQNDVAQFRQKWKNYYKLYILDLCFKFHTFKPTFISFSSIIPPNKIYKCQKVLVILKKSQIWIRLIHTIKLVLITTPKGVFEKKSGDYTIFHILNLKMAEMK